MWVALVWKEYRSQRGVLLAVIALATLGYWATCQWHDTRRGADRWFLAVPAAALAFGGMSIADERERGTLALLRRLPTHPFRVWAVKSATALGATAIVFGVLAAVAQAVKGLDTVPRNAVPVTVSLALVAWASAALCSNVTNQTLVAVAAGGALTMLLESLLFLWDTSLVDANFFGLRGDPPALIVRTVEVVLLGWAAYRLACGPAGRRRAARRQTA